jgi:hypothetical protein
MDWDSLFIGNVLVISPITMDISIRVSDCLIVI